MLSTISHQATDNEGQDSFTPTGRARGTGGTASRTGARWRLCAVTHPHRSHTGSGLRRQADAPKCSCKNAPGILVPNHTNGATPAPWPGERRDTLQHLPLERQPAMKSNHLAPCRDTGGRPCDTVRTQPPQRRVIWKR